MRDFEIRRALDAKLRSRYGDAAVIRHEMGLAAGSRRVDVAVISATELAGYEIKSDHDTMYRMHGQADAYNRVLDRATLVTTHAHLHAARPLLPNWWGLTVAAAGAELPTLHMIRRPRPNYQMDAFATAQLLWRDEALDELRKRGLGRGLSKMARYYLWQALADAVPLPDLRRAVLARLRSRTEWDDPRVHRAIQSLPAPNS